MQEREISSANKDKKNCFYKCPILAYSTLGIRQILIIACLSLFIIIPSLGQNPGMNLANNTTSVPLDNTTLIPATNTTLIPINNTTIFPLNNTTLASINNGSLIPANQSTNLTLNISSVNEVNLTTAIPEAIIVLPEQILPETVVISIAAIYKNTSAVFLINNSTINGNKVIIEAFSVEIGGNHSEYNIQPAQVTLNKLKVGRYELNIKDRLTDLSLYNSSFYIRPFGELFKENGLIGYLETYKGGLINGTMYLVPSPLNPICPPGLFNYTQIWANSTDQFFIGINISNDGRDFRDINLSFSNKSADLEINPRNASIRSLNDSSSILMLFYAEPKGLDPGIYNLTYNLSYRDGASNHTFTGELHIGIYQINTYLRTNDTISTKLVTPFGDYINQSAGEWRNYTINDLSVWLPDRISYNGSYSNFTLQEPKSPWLQTIIGGVVGGVIGGSAEIYHQCMVQQKLSLGDLSFNNLLQDGKLGKCNVDWAEVGLKTADAGLAGATLATFGFSTLAANVVKKKMIEGFIFNAGLETAYQGEAWLKGEKSTKDLVLDVSIAGIQGSIGAVGWHGAGRAAASWVKLQDGLSSGMYQSNRWMEIGRLGNSNKYLDKLDGAFKLAKNSPKLIAEQWGNVRTGVGVTYKATKWLYRDTNYLINNIFNDESGTSAVRVAGQYQGLDSPKVDETYIKELILKGSGRSTGEIDTSIILLFDASGSMGEYNKIDNAKIAAKNAISTLRPGEEVALIVFYDCDMIVVEQPFTTDWSTLASRIDLIEPHDMTPLCAANDFARIYMEQNAKGKIGRIIHFTDGIETCGTCGGSRP